MSISNDWILHITGYCIIPFFAVVSLLLNSYTLYMFHSTKSSSQEVQLQIVLAGNVLISDSLSHSLYSL